MAYQYMSTTPRQITLKATSTWDRDTAPTTKKNKTMRLREESRAGGQHLPSTAKSSKAILRHASRKSVQFKRISNYIQRETWTLTTHAKNKLAAAQTKMQRNMLSITYRNRITNTCVRKTTKVTNVIEHVVED